MQAILIIQAYTPQTYCWPTMAFARLTRTTTLTRGHSWRRNIPPCSYTLHHFQSSAAPRRTAATSQLKSEPAENESFGWKAFLNMIGYFDAESTAIRRSAAMSHSAEYQARRAGFIRLFVGDVEEVEVELDFHQQHQLYMLHMWMVHHRLLREGEPGKLLQESLFDAYWENTTRRIRSTGIPELTLNKHLSEVQRWSFGAAVSYDHAFAVEKGEGNGKELGSGNEKRVELSSALWRNVFQSNYTVDEKKVLALAGYVDRQVKALDELSSEEVKQGVLRWIDPPMHEPQDDDVSEWQLAHAIDGRPYYWNTITRQTTWQKPDVEEPKGN